MMKMILMKVLKHTVFTNVNRRLEDAIQDSFIDFDYSQEANNYCPDDYDRSDDVIDEFKHSTKNVNDLKSTLLIPHGLENKDSFHFVLLFAILSVALMNYKRT